MRAARADANQPAVVAALRKVGAIVYSLHRVGAGVPDLLVGFRGLTYLLEVKEPKGGVLTPQQIEFGLNWRGRPVSIVKSPDEALRAIGAVK